MTARTPAVAAADVLGLDHEVLVIERARSVEEAAERLGVPAHRLLKTLVVRVRAGRYVYVLVPGPRQLAWPKLRHHLGEPRLSLPDADEAREVTGYERGMITPLGARGAWPVLADAAITAEPSPVTIGGGAHGVSLRVDPHELVRALDAEVLELTLP